jgi:hypothetical protein
MDEETFDFVYNEFNKHLNLDFSSLNINNIEYSLCENEKEYLIQTIITHWIYYYTVNNLEIEIKCSDFNHPQTLDILHSMLMKKYCIEKYGEETSELIEFGSKILRKSVDEYTKTIKFYKNYYEFR